MPDLWVCFSLPEAEPPADTLVLSFLSPAAEDRVAGRWGARLLSGREVVQDVRARARRAYVEMIARAGATPCLGGRTLRQALRDPDGWSRWWFLKISEKDCVWDRDPIYTTMLRLMAVRAVSKKHDVKRVRLWGADPIFAATLDGRESRGQRMRAMIVSIAIVGRGLLARVAFAGAWLRRWWTCRRAVPAEGPFDVLLQAHWDWSVATSEAGDLRDRFFADLPDKLGERGIAVGWLASLEQDVEGWQRGRTLREVVRSAMAQPAVVLLESFLSPLDVLTAAFRLGDAFTVTACMRTAAFQRLFRVDGLDLYPIVRTGLLDSAWGTGLPRWELQANAVRRACERTTPRLILTFLEMFLEGRAIYAGARTASPSVRLWAVQHAAYASDKTFGALHSELELAGEPDGCPVPAPDGLFAMGPLTRRLWRANGFGDDQLVVTGGLRYQHVGVSQRRSSARPKSFTVLLIASMNERADLDMCEAAVAAVEDLPSLRLRLRDHPQYHLSQRAAFAAFRGRIDVSTADADGDLSRADVVLFTHSGFAEEALLRGVPTWQWLWGGFNTSVFVDLTVIPTFTSVSGLRRALRAFIADPEAHQPAPLTQELVLRECFGPEPARATERIVEHIGTLLETRRA